MYNLLIGGAAGDGVETTAALLEKSLKRTGVHVFGIRDVMSRIRGGHNFAQIRFGPEPIATHQDALDGIIALNLEGYELHKWLSTDGFIIGDPSLGIEDPRLIPANLLELAKEAGNAKAIGSVAIGMVLKLFSLDDAAAQTAFRENLAPNILPANLDALQAGYACVDTARYPLKTTPLDESVLITGGAAMALGALAGDVRFYSAYPMSPSTGIMEYLAAHGEDMGVAVEQAEDEIAAINMALGASVAGTSAMTGTSGGGFSLMVEALGFAGIAEIPIVIADIQRPGPATGLPTRTEQSDLRFVISASQGEFPRMVISVRDHAGCYRQTVRALRLAETYQIPVILLGDQYLADSAAIIPLAELLQIQESAESILERAEADTKREYRRYRLTDSGVSPRLIPGESEHIVRTDSDEHDEYGVITESAEMRKQMVDKRMCKLELLESELDEPAFVGEKGFGTLVIGFGSTCGAITESVKRLNHRDGFAYGALCFGDVYPLPTKRLLQCAGRAKQVVNVEQNATGQLAALVRETTGITCQHSILKYDGRPLSVDDIFTGLMSLEEEAANE